MNCDRCKKETRVGIYTKSGMVCESCHMHIEPYILELSFNRSNGYLYNKTQDTMETIMTPEDFQACGWFLREKRMRGVFSYLKLEYHGKVRCSRCENYIFPANMLASCGKFTFCGLSRVETPKLLRVNS